MGFLSRTSKRTDDKDDSAFEEPASEAPPTPPPDFTMPDVRDSEAMSDYIAKRLVVESQFAPSASNRIAALRSLADLTVVTASTKYTVAARARDSTVTNIVVVQENLNRARELGDKHSRMTITANGQ